MVTNNLCFRANKRRKKILLTPLSPEFTIWAASWENLLFFTSKNIGANQLQGNLAAAQHLYMSRSVRKLVFGVSNQIRHKPGCTATEDGLRLEISELESRGIVLSKWRKQRRWSASLLPWSWSASLFSHMQKLGFLSSRLIYSTILLFPKSET